MQNNQIEVFTPDGGAVIKFNFPNGVTVRAVFTGGNVVCESENTETQRAISCLGCVSVELFAFFLARMALLPK